MYKTTFESMSDSSPQGAVSIATGDYERAVAATQVAKLLHSQLALLAEVLRTSDAHRNQDVSLTAIETAAEFDRRVDEAVNSCSKELLTMQPGSPRSSGIPDAALRRDKAALDRGARMRSVYQHASRHDAATVSYVSEIARGGADVRTFDEVISRLIVIDHRVAFVPTAANDSTAVMITQPVVVAYLARLFEYVWARADPFLPHTVQNITTSPPDLIVRLLIEGATGSAIAKRLGISERTLAKHIAKLKKECNATSSFQLGYRLATIGSSR